MKREEPVVYDLDSIAAWLADPSVETVDCGAFLAVWNLFGDIARSCPGYGVSFVGHDEQLGAVYEKLFHGNNLPSVTPPGEHYVPALSREEIAGLRQTFQVGLRMFLAVRRAQT